MTILKCVHFWGIFYIIYIFFCSFIYFHLWPKRIIWALNVMQSAFVLVYLCARQVQLKLFVYILYRCLVVIIVLLMQPVGPLYFKVYCLNLLKTPPVSLVTRFTGAWPWLSQLPLWTYCSPRINLNKSTRKCQSACEFSVVSVGAFCTHWSKIQVGSDKLTQMKRVWTTTLSLQWNLHQLFKGFNSLSPSFFFLK